MQHLRLYVRQANHPPFLLLLQSFLVQWAAGDHRTDFPVLVGVRCDGQSSPLPPQGPFLQNTRGLGSSSDSAPHRNCVTPVSFNVSAIRVCQCQSSCRILRRLCCISTSSAEPFKIHKALHYHTSNVTVWQLILLKGQLCVAPAKVSGMKVKLKLGLERKPHSNWLWVSPCFKTSSIVYHLSLTTKTTTYTTNIDLLSPKTRRVFFKTKQFLGLFLSV